MKYYLILCKNDFPPVNYFQIFVYGCLSDIPRKYYNVLSEGYDYRFGEILKKEEDLFFVVQSKDPVDAMISFWGAYMYFSVPKND